MILKNNRWYDYNDNSWPAGLETEESATIKSKSLINCSSCRDCRSCRDCHSCHSCSSCSSCTYCSYCHSCSSCSSCSSCRDFKNDPFKLIFKNVGSRDSELKIYWLCDRTLVITGCFSGTLSHFEKAVEKTHGDNKQGKRYREIINQVWQLMEI